jgi:predicted subunit of tRNA(5-methylaminomethyl-2-thiouridylate) methyltransferase
VPKLITKEPFVRQSISFPRSVLADAKRIVIEEERHGNISRYIQDLVISDLTRREEAKADKGEAA